MLSRMESLSIPLSSSGPRTKSPKTLRMRFGSCRRWTATPSTTSRSTTSCSLVPPIKILPLATDRSSRPRLMTRLTRSSLIKSEPHSSSTMKRKISRSTKTLRLLSSSPRPTSRADSPGARELARVSSTLRPHTDTLQWFFSLTKRRLKVDMLSIQSSQPSSTSSISSKTLTSSP